MALNGGLFGYFNEMFKKISADLNRAVSKADESNHLQSVPFKQQAMHVCLIYTGITLGDLPTEVYINIWIEDMNPCTFRLLISVNRPDKGKYNIEMLNRTSLFKYFDINEIAQEAVNYAVK